MNENVGYCFKVTPLNSSGTKLSFMRELFPLTTDLRVDLSWLSSRFYGCTYKFSDSFFCGDGDNDFSLVFAYRDTLFFKDFPGYFYWSNPVFSSLGISRVFGSFFIFKAVLVDDEEFYPGCFSIKEATAIEKFIFEKL